MEQRTAVGRESRLPATIGDDRKLSTVGGKVTRAGAYYSASAGIRCPHCRKILDIGQRIALMNGAHFHEGCMSDWAESEIGRMLAAPLALDAAGMILRLERGLEVINYHLRQTARTAVQVAVSAPPLVTEDRLLQVDGLRIITTLAGSLIALLRARPDQLATVVETTNGILKGNRG